MGKCKKSVVGITQIVLVFFLVFTVDAGASSWLEKGTKALESFAPTGASTGTSSGISGLPVEEIGAGLKEALKVGAGNVVKQLGAENGFNADPKVHIPLPQSMKTVKGVLGKVGMSSMADDLELRLNRAAEAATPKAKQLFLNAISEMSFDDVKKIYDGPKDAATQYFKGKMTPELAQEMKPVVDNSLVQVGAIQAYDNVMQEYKSLPFVPDVKANLSEYVVEKGMDGIFFYMAQEEAAIRENPAKRTTELLKKVFGK
jgi:hypothetical protein